MITIKRAIEVLEENQPNKIPLRNVEFWRAVKLGGEALKALPKYRNKLKHPELWLLPGETEE